MKGCGEHGGRRRGGQEEQEGRVGLDCVDRSEQQQAGQVLWGWVLTAIPPVLCRVEGGWTCV